MTLHISEEQTKSTLSINLIDGSLELKSENSDILNYTYILLSEHLKELGIVLEDPDRTDYSISFDFTEATDQHLNTFIPVLIADLEYDFTVSPE